MQRRQQARTEIGRMRHQLHATLVGELHDLQELGDAADLGHRGLSVGDRACIHHLRELIGGTRVLSGRNTEPAPGAHLRQRRKILRWPHRLFQEQRRRLAACVGKGDRRGAVHWAVHVDHQGNICADRLPRRLYRCQGGLVQLDRGIALADRLGAFARDKVRCADPQQARIGRNPGALLRAQQLVQRHALHAGGKVPQRDVEPRNRKHRDAVAAEQMQIALDLFHEGGNSGGVRHLLATGLRRDHLVDRSIGRERADIAEGIAPAGETCVCGDFDQNDVECGD
ncbi:hypothetical protein ES703_123561 [subsurface metagenome]